MDKRILIKQSLEKVVVNSGIGRLSQQAQFEEKVLPELMKELALITGQKPQIRKSRESIAGFKVRKNQIIGLRVILRHDRMADFLERVTNAVLPRIRDFQGIDPQKIDAAGNLNFGIKEQNVFPEIIPEESKVSFGIQVTVVPKEKNRVKAEALYRQIGVPLHK